VSDAKPYTADELAYWESMSEALPAWNHRAKLRATVEALERVTKERDEAMKALAHADTGHMRRVCERDEARAALRSLKEEYEIMRVDGIQIRAAHDLMASEKERAEHAHNELVLSLPAMRRDVAAKQRALCAQEVWAKSQCGTASELGEIASHVRATPLVTDSTEREVES
jgi:N-acyl-D-aspartate/D-glutamate deacylase